MNFFNPWNLLWLPPLLSGILALWMLRRKRQEVVVSSLFLWQSLLQDSQADRPFQKLRRNLLLFLQLLAAFLLVFALAGPFVYGRGMTGRTLVVILDTSASMSATDVYPTRLDSAKDAAKGFLRHEMNGSDVATVITAGTRPETRIGRMGDRARLEDAIDRIQGTDAPGDMAAALALALSLTAGRTGGEVRVFTDGDLDPDQAARLAALPVGPTQVRQQVIGSPTADNVAITALDGRRDPTTGRPEVFVAVRHFGARPPAGGTLSLLQDGKLIDARALMLTDGAQSETFDSPLLAQGGVITARLDTQDDLPTDNQASLVLSPPTPRRVLLVTRGNVFLERGLNTDPDVRLEECAPDQFAAEGRSGLGYSLVVFDGGLPAGPLPPGNFLVFGAGSARTLLAPSGGRVASPSLVDEDPTHPVMRFVDLHGLRLRTIPRLTLMPGATALAGGSGPWIAARDTGDHRMVSVGFDLSDSDWPLRVSFPIFLANAVDWLTQGARPGGTAPQTLAGQPFSVVMPPGAGALSVVRPDGKVQEAAAPVQGRFVETDTSQAGVYHVRSASGAVYPVAVDLLDASASDLSPRAVAALDHTGVTVTSADIPPSRRAKSDLWPAVAGIALVALLLEWVAYHRRWG